MGVPLPLENISCELSKVILSQPFCPPHSPLEGWDCWHVPPYPVSHAIFQVECLMALHNVASKLWSGNYVNLN